MAKPNDLKDRSKNFAVRTLKLVDTLTKTLSAQTIGRQLVRSATSVAANYRAACRGRSNAEFIAKMGIVKAELVTELLDEADQLTAIRVASIKTARGGKR